MGSKCFKAKKHQEEPPEPQDNRPSEVDVYTNEKFHEKAYQQLKDDFENNLDMFLLNNILLSVMFYENYEKEIASIREGITKTEKEINDTLMREHSRQCIMTDSMFHKVNQRVRFVARHGKRKKIVQPLIPMRMYIVQDTIEITNQTEETDHYSLIDKPTTKVMVEPSNHAGYVKLRLMQTPNMKRYPSQTSMSSVLYMDGQTALKNGYVDTLEDPSPSTSFDGEESDYDYARVNDARTEQPIEPIEKRSNSGGLPSGCIIDVKFRNAQQNETELYKIVKYINSERFMVHFSKTEFPLQIAKGLGYTKDEIKNATHTATAVYCSRLDSEKNCESRAEIVPAVLNTFPDMSYWSARDRKTVVGPSPQNILYMFPTKRMVKEVCTQPSVVVPRGYMQKKGDNVEKKCEWEVAFPKAERYLMERMVHGQIRCFLFLTILLKSFIEPKTEQKGLTIDHIRNLIYWECEDNYLDWPEHRLGDKLKIIMKKLYHTLGRRSMMDYFVKGKNVFENIPTNELYHAQSIVHQVLENPVMFALSGLKNLEVVTDFPTLDFHELYKLLVMKGEAERRVAPGAFKTHQPTLRVVPRKLTEDQLWQLKYEEQMKAKRLKQKEEEEKQKANLNKQKRESVDSIDLHFKPKSDLLNENYMRQKTFLMLFITHFLKIVDYSFENGSYSQCLLYLDQVMYLARILQEVDSVEADAILKEVKRKQEQAEEHRLIEDTSPITPSRNSVHNFNYIFKNQSLNVNNVNQAYQKGVQRPSQALPPQANQGLSFIEMNRMSQENSNGRKKTTVRINSTPTVVNR